MYHWHFRSVSLSNVIKWIWESVETETVCLLAQTACCFDTLIELLYCRYACHVLIHSVIVLEGCISQYT